MEAGSVGWVGGFLTEHLQGKRTWFQVMTAGVEEGPSWAGSPWQGMVGFEALILDDQPESVQPLAVSVCSHLSHPPSLN